MEIRRGDLTDFNQLSAIAQALKWQKHLAFIERRLQHREVLVACIRDEALGFIIWDRTFFSRAFIWLLGVSPTAQRKGCGSALIARVEAACAGEPLFTSTNSSNLPMQALCRKLGFAESGYLKHLDEGDPELFFFKQL